jgi:hypothetical protein
MMQDKTPNARPEHYLLPRAAGLAALQKLSLKHPDPINWIHQEQTLNDRVTCKGDYPIEPSSVPSDFWPERQPVFWLPEFEAPRDQFRLLQNPARPLPWYISGASSGWFSHLVHPLTMQYFLSREIGNVRWRAARFLATPMASHRTLLVWSPRSKTPPFAVKTSVNLWIGGLNRNVRLKEIKRSVGISSIFAEIPRATLEQQGILLLDDPVGIVHKQTNAGLLAREIPARLGAGEEIVPLFSLVAARNLSRPRIVDLIMASRLTPTAWVDQFVFQPLIYQAYFLAMTTGLVGEMHEQNILLELRKGKPTGRFWQRDLGGFGVDRELRSLANKDFEDLPAGIHERDLGENCALLHLLLRMYLQESIGYAIGYALGKHFGVPTEDFVGLYKLRVSELQKRVLAANGVGTTRNFEKDLDRYRKRKQLSFNWPWKKLEDGLRNW